MQGIDGLLIKGLDGDGRDVFVASSFEEGFGIGAVRLVALAISGYVSGGQQRHLMAEGLELSPPVVCRATGLHEDVGGRAMKEEVAEALSGEAMMLLHAARRRGNSDLEDRLCEIHGDLGSIHEDSSPVFGLRGR